MLESVLDLLQRQREFMLRQEKRRDLIVQARPFLDALRAEERLRVHLDDLRREGNEHRATLATYNAAAIGRLVALGADLREGFPRAAEAIPPGHPVPPHTWTHFDGLAEGTMDLPEYEAPEEQRDPTVAAKLLRFLGGRLKDIANTSLRNEDEGIAEKASPYWDRFNEAERLHEYTIREFLIMEAVHAGSSLRRIERVVRLLNHRPTPEELQATGGGDLSPWEKTQGAVTFAVFATKPNPPSHFDYEKEADNVAEVLRRDVDRLCEELRRRLGTIRSHRALIDRFRRQCEWYASREFRDLAGRLAKLERSKASKENPLRDHLARYLFDQGLNPLTDPLMGGLKPDVVDFSLYVEAKQYGEGEDPKAKIKKAAAQVWSTAPKIQGDPWRVHEVFLVIFRRGGRNVQLPEIVPGNAGVHLYPVLVDVIDSLDAGSRERDVPLVITADDLAPTTDDRSTKRRASRKLPKPPPRRSSSASRAPSRGRRAGTR